MLLDHIYMHSSSLLWSIFLKTLKQSLWKMLKQTINTVTITLCITQFCGIVRFCTTTFFAPGATLPSSSTTDHPNLLLHRTWTHSFISLHLHHNYTHSCIVGPGAAPGFDTWQPGRNTTCSHVRAAAGPLFKSSHTLRDVCRLLFLWRKVGRALFMVVKLLVLGLHALVTL